jgi:hypothetical protein
MSSPEVKDEEEEVSREEDAEREAGSMGKKGR